MKNGKFLLSLEAKRSLLSHLYSTLYWHFYLSFTANKKSAKIGNRKGNQSFVGNMLTYRYMASLIAQLVKNLPAMRDTCIWSLGWEDPLEKGMATHSSILAWRIPWTGLYSPWGLKESNMIEQLSLSLLIYVENLLELVNLVRLQKKKEINGGKPYFNTLVRDINYHFKSFNPML